MESLGLFALAHLLMYLAAHLLMYLAAHLHITFVVVLRPVIRRSDVFHGRLEIRNIPRIALPPDSSESSSAIGTSES
jgi:hypothetical protein